MKASILALLLGFCSLCYGQQITLTFDALSVKMDKEWIGPYEVRAVMFLNYQDTHGDILLVSEDVKQKYMRVSDITSDNYEGVAYQQMIAVNENGDM